MITPKNNNLVLVTLYSFTYIGLSVNLKTLTTLLVQLSLKVQHIMKKSPQLNDNKSSGLGYA
jgi:hypothetical protein